MKILHTSDWHLGHTLYNYDRTEEQMSMLAQMVKIARDEKPDLFLLSGDVYHTPQPSAAVQTMFTEALVRIHDANPEMTIVVTAGNHDSGSKHEIFRTPWKALKVHTIGSIERENPQEHIIEIKDKGYLLAVPYANGRNIPEDFFQQLIDAVVDINGENLPVVMTAHTTVKGCDFAGHDHASEFSVGGIDTIDIEQMGEGYDYLALGHIHHQQWVHTGRHNVRYSGTPIAVSFDENYSHSVSIVEIAKHFDKPRLKEIEIHNPRPLVSLPAAGYASWEEAKKKLAAYPDDIPAYIRLNVEIEDFLPVEANAEAIELTKDKQCRFCCINAKRNVAKRLEERIMTVREFQSEKPIDIAKRYAEDIGVLLDEDMVDLFNEALSDLAEDLRNN